MRPTHRSRRALNYSADPDDSRNTVPGEITMKKIVLLMLIGATVTPTLSAVAADGVNRLIQVQQMKANEANNDAQQGADKQRDLLKKQKELRGSQNAFENKPVRDPVLRQQLLTGLSPANDLQPKLSQLGMVLRDMGSIHKRSPRDPALHIKTGEARSILIGLITATNQLKAGFANADKHIPSNGGQSQTDELRKKFEDAMKDLESQDKLGNFEIQRLMSDYNEAQALASSVKRKADDTNSSVIGKI
jgi:hypothetical protein